MIEIEQFYKRKNEQIEKMSKNADLAQLTRDWFAKANSFEYSYHFSWLSRPIIQYPQDIVAIQELIWKIKPDLIIETGIAHGGSLIFSASMLALLDFCEAIQNGTNIDPGASTRKVLGVDIDIRTHNRDLIEAHPLSANIRMIEGSSIDKSIIKQVYDFSKPFKKIMIFLDSNHTHDHVLSELQAYAPLTSIGSYCVVFDTAVEFLPEDAFSDRPWCIGNNPLTARNEFLEDLVKNPQLGRDGHGLSFVVDTEIDDKIMISVAPGGYLKRIR